MHRREWSALMLACLALAALARAGDPAADAKEREKLQGTWSFVKSSGGGPKKAPRPAVRLVFQGDTIAFVTEDNKRLASGAYTVNPRVNPKALEIALDKDGAKAITQAIYELDGDTLKLCHYLGPKAGKERPTQFAADAHTVLGILKREAPAHAPPTGKNEKRRPKLLSNSIGMKLAFIPPGEFLMGASASDPDAEEHEKPQHKVRITKPFYLGVHEVTVGQFRAFVRATGHQTGAETDGKGSSGYNAELRGFEYGKPGYTWKRVGWKQDDDHPVLNVTSDDALAFCRWLGDKENKRYRLPREAEWEHACRAGTTTRFFSGDALEDTEKIANVLDQSLIEKWEAAARDWRLGKPHKYNVPMKWNDGHPFTAPVGRFKPNPFGLYDMHGNAAEWCADWYDKDYYKNSPATDPAGPAKTTTRVVRGGTFLSNPKVARASMRVASFPDYHNYVIGFRVLLEDAADAGK